MSATLLFLVPIGLLGVAWSLCFVGCTYPTFDFPTPYSDLVLGTASQTNLIAYWPMRDLLVTLNPENTGPLIEGDASGHKHNGTYTIPPAYPINPPVNLSAPIGFPSLFRQPSIVPGEAGGMSNPLATSVDFEGGYLSIPWSTQNSPSLDQFTLEAWIKPSANAAGFLSVIFGAVTDTGGFSIYVDENNQLGITIGNGGGLMRLPATNAFIPAIPAIYVAVTCMNGGVFTIWVNPDPGDIPNAPPPPPNWGPTPTNYVAADPSQLVHCFIGADANNKTLRTQDFDPNGAPLYPFQGRIQSVALYGQALDAATVVSHFSSGIGRG